MRLAEYEIKAIKKAFNETFVDGKIFLFGSRTDDTKRGGDIDQFLFRFSKLQDSMGEKLFSTMLFLLGEDFSKKPFIDLLNRLDKMELLHRDEWMNLRKIRNDVAHKYSFNVDELADSLNDILKVKNNLIDIYDIFYKYCHEKFEFVKESRVFKRIF